MTVSWMCHEFVINVSWEKSFGPLNIPYVHCWSGVLERFAGFLDQRKYVKDVSSQMSVQCPSSGGLKWEARAGSCDGQLLPGADSSTRKRNLQKPLIILFFRFVKRIQRDIMFIRNNGNGLSKNRWDAPGQGWRSETLAWEMTHMTQHQPRYWISEGKKIKYFTSSLYNSGTDQIGAVLHHWLFSSHDVSGPDIMIIRPVLPQ